MSYDEEPEPDTHDECRWVISQQTDQIAKLTKELKEATVEIEVGDRAIHNLVKERDDARAALAVTENSRNSNHQKRLVTEADNARLLGLLEEARTDLKWWADPTARPNGTIRLATEILTDRIDAELEKKSGGGPRDGI